VFAQHLPQASSGLRLAAAARSIGVLACLSGCGVALADCEDLVALAKISTGTVVTRDRVEDAAATFCREFKKDSSSRNSAELQASYEVLISGSGSTSASTFEQISDKYCSRSSSGSVSADSYKTYAISISPVAFESYNTCILNRANLPIRYDISPANRLQKDLAVAATNISGIRSSKVVLSAQPQGGVTCGWNGSALSSKISRTNVVATAILRCTRLSGSATGAILITSDNSNAKPQSIVWPAMDEHGNPVELLATLESEFRTTLVRLSRVELRESIRGIFVRNRTTGLCQTPNVYTPDPKICECTSGYSIRPLLRVPNILVGEAGRDEKIGDYEIVYCTRDGTN
jgi:hypothetical protein